MTARRKSDISESFESMWMEYVLTSSHFPKVVLQAIARDSNIKLRGNGRVAKDALAAAILNKADRRRLLPTVKAAARASDPELLRFEEAKKAYSLFSHLGDKRLVVAIKAISNNDELKRILERGRVGKRAARMSVPPSILRRVLLAELYTIPREVALKRLTKAGVRVA